MQSMGSRLSKVEDRLSKIESNMAVVDEKMVNMSDVLQERRRQTDHIEDLMGDIAKQVTDINTKLFGYRSTVLAILRTTITMTTFFSAVGAGIWAIVTYIFDEQR